MSRKKRIYKKNTNILQEPVFNDNVLLKFINCLMFDGKKSVAEKLVYNSFREIRKETSVDPIIVFNDAIRNTTPVVQVKSIRIAGSNYQVPMEIPTHRQIMLAIKWIIESARKRTEKTMVERLSKELIDAYKNSGKAIDKKISMHKMAESNRAYAHYRWQ
uniref:Small ribosomal subunit protein uS7m n=1 Tax=Reclinomonas americana TaxID=48483 RepID=RT07_RECAM|nr:ribosomal protein S7 [Reclinomonas americana]O21240.1 RecName: Full=Small ribosomal subunit protein uS7m; AltName: Full=Ribosomal protein S7, mitochondrial [Reclinomonas americana]AAD11867.1 ribosomal protein S7 [Reclinomonas americana]